MTAKTSRREQQGGKRASKMKPSSLVCASIAALAALALTTDSVFASIALNSSRSNVYRTINLNDPEAVPACKASGGTVWTNSKGQSGCVTSDPKAFQACEDQGGTIVKGSNGEDICMPHGKAGLAVSDPGTPGSGTHPAHIPGRP